MEKYRLVRERLQAKVRSDRGANRTSGVHCEFVVSPLATVEELATTHDPRYIDRFVRGVQTPVEIRNVGFPWSPQGVERALSSAGGTVAAACAAVEESLKRRSLLRSEPSSTSSSSTSSRSRRVPPCWAAHVAGGTHHAFHDHGEGFCVFSDIAVAANVVRGRYEEHVRSILVLDLDVHQGNGNAVLFRDRDDVFTFSMHCSSNYFSPKQQSDLDIELPAGCTDETYLITLHHWLQKLRKERTFDLVFYQAGVDVLECDRLGQLSLSSRGVERRNQLVYDLCLDLDVPLVITMGGGYPKHGGPWDPIIDAHCAVYWQAHQALANLSLPSDASTRPSL
jgi:acetoin utilization deacetylase AcuC-like enzyme